MSNITPQDPVTLGMCSQTELDTAVQKAQAKQQRQQEREDRDRAKQRADSLAAAGEAGMPSAQQQEEEAAVPVPDTPVTPPIASIVPPTPAEPPVRKDETVSSVFGEQSPKKEDDDEDEAPRAEDVFKN
jgi:hypothetical protein